MYCLQSLTAGPKAQGKRFPNARPGPPSQLLLMRPDPGRQKYKNGHVRTRGTATRISPPPEKQTKSTRRNSRGVVATTCLTDSERDQKEMKKRKKKSRPSLHREPCNTRMQSRMKNSIVGVNFPPVSNSRRFVSCACCEGCSACHIPGCHRPRHVQRRATEDGGPGRKKQLASSARAALPCARARPLAGRPSPREEQDTECCPKPCK